MLQSTIHLGQWSAPTRPLETSSELLRSGFISLSGAVYLTGDYRASGKALETKATQMKEDIILSLPSAGSQSTAESIGEND